MLNYWIGEGLILTGVVIGLIAGVIVGGVGVGVPMWFFRDQKEKHEG